MFRRRELDAPDAFEEMCRQGFERICASLRGKSDAEIQGVLLSHQKNSDIYPALLFWTLLDAEPFERLFQHIRNVTVDNYAALCSLLQTVCEKKFSLLSAGPLKKVLTLVDELIGLEAVAADPCLAALCRQIPSGSSTPKTLATLTLIFNIVRKHRSIVAARPLLLSSIMYHFVRVLPELTADQKLLSGLGAFTLQLIVDFPTEWQSIGRDALRVLSLTTNVYHPLKAHYEMSLPNLEKQTPSSFLLSRLTPDMEEKLSFVLGEVALGCQQRYLTWFMTKFIRNADSIVFDLVRYLCSVGRQKLPSWVILGWLVKTYQQSSFISQITRCILFDFIFFRPNDDLQRLEPGFLLMLNSVRGYQDVTQLLLETLIDCAHSFQPASLRTQIRSSIENALMKAASTAGVQTLSLLFITPNLRNSLTALFPRAFSPASPQSPASSPSSPPSLKRAASSSTTSPVKVAKNSPDSSQIQLGRILSRLPNSLKEPFTNLFIIIYNNEPTDDPERQIHNLIASIILYLTSNDVRDDSLHRIASSLADLLKKQLSVGVFRPSRVLQVVFRAARESPSFLSQLRTADVQFGFHMLDWARASTSNLDVYVQVITASGSTVSDDIAACRTACPLHTSTLLLFAFEHLLPYCCDPASFTFLITSCSPSELSDFSCRIATSRAYLISTKFSENDHVRIAIEFSTALNSLPCFQQVLGWSVLSNSLSMWRNRMIFAFTDQYFALLDAKQVKSHDLEGIASIWKSVCPSKDASACLFRISPQYQESFVYRAVLHWFNSHPAVLLDVISETFSTPQCKIFSGPISLAAENPSQWIDFANSLFLERLTASTLGQNDHIRKFCSDLLQDCRYRVRCLYQCLRTSIRLIWMDGQISLPHNYHLMLVIFLNMAKSIDKVFNCQQHFEIGNILVSSNQTADARYAGTCLLLQMTITFNIICKYQATITRI